MNGATLVPKLTGSLTLDRTSLTMSITKMTDYVRVTRAGNGVILAVSSDPTVAAVCVEGERIRVEALKKGSCQVTVSVTGGTHHDAPQSKTFTVNCNNLPSTVLADCSWSQIRSVTDAGVADKFFKVGDLTALVPFKGTVGGTAFDVKFRFRIVDMTPSIITLLQSVNAEGVETMIADRRGDAQLSQGDEGICMNLPGQIGTTVDPTLSTEEKQNGTNRGGYANSLGAMLMDQYANCVPSAMLNALRLTNVFSDNAGALDLSPDAITCTRHKFFIPSEIEIRGNANWKNPHLKNYLAQWKWFANGNTILAYAVNRQSFGKWWYRDASSENTWDFRHCDPNWNWCKWAAKSTFGLRGACTI